MTDDRLLRLAEVTQLTGISKSTLDRMERRGAFPRRLRLGYRSVAWRESEINAWLKNLKPEPVYYR